MPSPPGKLSTHSVSPLGDHLWPCFPPFALLGDLDENPVSRFLFSPPGGFHSFLSQGAKEKETIAN